MSRTLNHSVMMMIELFPNQTIDGVVIPLLQSADISIVAVNAVQKLCKDALRPMQINELLRYIDSFVL